jgi:hypothetical protein
MLFLANDSNNLKYVINIQDKLQKEDYSNVVLVAKKCNYKYSLF